MQKTLVSALALAAALTAGPAFASSYSSLWVFGDSLSDNGNFYAFTGGYPPSPYWNGRFSNGPVAVEWMATAMGVPLVDYAVGGAKTGPNPVGGSDHENPAYGGLGLGMLAQVGRATATGPLNSSALYVVWGGANDFFAMGPTPANVTIGTAVGNMSQALLQLYGDGARHFFVPLMPDLGLTPDARAGGPATMAGGTALTNAYNGALESVLENIDISMMPGGDIQFFDTATFLRDAVNDPAGHAFSDVADACVLSSACVADGVNQGNALGYLFWDGVHPTALAQEQLGLAFAAAVPEPETYTMVLAGLGILGAVARRRRAA